MKKIARILKVPGRRRQSQGGGRGKEGMERRWIQILDILSVASFVLIISLFFPKLLNPEIFFRMEDGHSYRLTDGERGWMIDI